MDFRVRACGWRRARLLVVIAAVVVWAAGAAIGQTARQSDVRYISTSELAHLLRKPGTAVLLDVRERDEYAVSRLSGALNVNPAAEPEALAARLRNTAGGKMVVLYCTSGARSTDLAVFVDDHLRRSGSTAVYVLKGGIVAWHNEKRPLVDRRGRSNFVHPFNEEMKRHMQRPELARMEPSRGRE